MLAHQSAKNSKRPSWPQAQTQTRQAIAEALEKERGVKSWKSFYVYFKMFNLKEFFDEQQAWQKDAEIFVAMDQAWDAYSDKLKAEEAAKQELRDADETKAIDPETKNP